jgi:hypothetical protein
MSFESKLEAVIFEFMEGAGIPRSEFDPSFAAKMVRAMMVSHRKYGYVKDAYPHKMDAMADMMTRRGAYRTHGNFWFLVDVANFAMIEAMHPNHPDAHWGENDAHNSPGRNSRETRRLQQIDNDGGRLGGDTFLHIPQDILSDSNT